MRFHLLKVRSVPFVFLTLCGSLNSYGQDNHPPRPSDAKPAAQEPAQAAPPARRTTAKASGDPGLAKYVNPNTVFEVDTYSKAVIVPNTGKTVYISGQIPLDKAFTMIGKGDLRAQTKQCLKNLELVMKAAGVKKNDVVKLGVNIVYKTAQDTFAVAEELQSFFDRDEMPATTMVGTPFIVNDGILIQIEATAVIKE